MRKMFTFWIEARSRLSAARTWVSAALHEERGGESREQAMFLLTALTRLAVGFAVACCFVWWGFDRENLRMQLTLSAPVGVYKEFPIKKLEKEQLVLMCLDGWQAAFSGERGYLKRARNSACITGLDTALKEVLGLGGETVWVEEDGSYRIGDRVLPALPVGDSEGRALDPWYGRSYIIPEGDVFLGSVNGEPLGLDSRVIGPVPGHWIYREVKPMRVTKETEKERL